MKFKTQNPQPGDVRTITYFAWTPALVATTKNGHPFVDETRWLETVTIRQQWAYGNDGYEWVNREFID